MASTMKLSKLSQAFVAGFLLFSSFSCSAHFSLFFKFTLAFSSFHLPPPHSRFVREATSAPPVVYYDYIIIGGGTSGCPLAATLSHGATVLVLERGGSPYNNSKITHMSRFATTLSNTSPSSPTQQFISRDGVPNARGRILGGGSAVNAGFYSRASRHYVKEAGWNEMMVNQSYRWVEKLVAFQPPISEWQSAVRNGLIEAGVLPYNGFTYDHMYGTKVGGTIFDRQGYRHSAADLLQYAFPRDLTVYLHATVHKILFLYHKERKPKAFGVIFKDAHGVKHRAYLKRNFKNEIILSAGAIGSPQLLMLSGIGPAHHLKAHKIKVVSNQPMVGQGMADNPMNLLYIPSPRHVEVSLIQVVGITKFDTYIETASGMSFDHSLAHRLSEAYHLLFNQSDQPFTIAPEAMGRATRFRAATLRGGIILEKVMGPRSTGHLELRNSNPNDNPSVTFNYFKEPEDLRRCVEGMRTVISVVNSKAFSKFRDRKYPVQSLLKLMVSLPINLRPKHVRAAVSLEQFCRDTVMTMWHYHGGCQIGRVVDRDYKVFGVNALRVIDGSTFHQSPGTNPQATVMMLGRYMGKRILKERYSKGRIRQKKV